MFDNENANPLPIRPRVPSSASMGSATTSRSTSGQQTRRSSMASIGKKEKKELENTLALLALEKNDNRRLRMVVEELRREITIQTRQTKNVESDLVEVTANFMKVNQGRLEALREVTRIKGQLKLYEVHLDAAKAEIRRAQDVINEMNRRKSEAEDSVAKYRNIVQKLSQEAIAREWKDEGVKEGFIQGMERARAEAEAFKSASEAEPPVIPSRDTRGSSILEDDSYYQDEERSRQRYSSTTDFTTYTRADTLGTTANTAPPPSSSPPIVPVHVPFHEANPPDDEPLPVPAPHPTTHLNSGDIRPNIIHNIPPSPRHPPFRVPPDGFIPVADSASHISIPPSHELGLPPPIPSPTLTGQYFREPQIVPPPGATYTVNVMTSHQPTMRHPSSPESNSTTISQIEIVKDTAKYSPMSAILEEVSSEHTSPIPSMSGVQDLHRNTSLRSSRSTPSSHAMPSRQDDHRSHHSQSPATHRTIDRKSSLASVSSKPGVNAADIYGIYTRPVSPHGGSRGRATPAMNAAGSAHYAPSVLDDTSFFNKTPKTRVEELPEEPPRRNPLDDTSFLTKTPRAQPQELPGGSHNSGQRMPTYHAFSNQEPSRTQPVLPRIEPGIYTRPYSNSLHAEMGSVYKSPSWHSESSANIDLDVESPTPPQQYDQQFEDNPREFREFLSASDAERAPPPMLPSQPENTLYSVPTPGTPIATPGGIFIPTGPPASPNRTSPRPSSPRPLSPVGPRSMPLQGNPMPGGYIGITPGEPEDTGAPVIPPENLLQGKESDSDSDALGTPPGTRKEPSMTAATRGRGRGGTPARGKKKKR